MRSFIPLGLQNRLRLALSVTVWLAILVSADAAATTKVNGIVAIAGRTNALIEFKSAEARPASRYWLERGGRVEGLELTAIDPKAGMVTVVVDGVASTLPLSVPPNGIVPTLNLKDADTRSVLELYQQLAGRTVLRSPTLPVAKITLQSAAGLGHSAAVELLGQTLRDNGIFVQPRGDKFTFATEFSKVPRLSAIPDQPADPPTATADAKSEIFPPGLIRFNEADREQVLDIYQELTGRTVLRSPSLPASKFDVKSQTAMSRAQTVWMLDALFYLSGISVVNEGKQFAFVLPGNRNAAAPQVPAHADEERLKKKPFLPAGMLKFSDAPVDQVLPVYAELVGREALPIERNLPRARFKIKTQTSLHAVEAVYALDALAALHQLRFVPVGDKQVKFVHVKDASPSAGQP